MKRSGWQYLYSLILSLLLMWFAVPDGTAQLTDLPGGNINSYSKVTAVGPDWVELADNLPGFAINEKVLLIQMKGAELNVGGSIYGSEIFTSRGDYGYYEFIIIDAVSTLPDRITFKNDIRGLYDPDSYVQLVKLPQYENVAINGTIGCPAWNEASGTGGVLAFLADNNVYLNSNIDVSEKGFEGGVSDEIQGLLIPTADLDPDLLDFIEADNKSAHKGKGIASHVTVNTPFPYADLARGKGRLGNGGGGGNGRFAGGGGGSSYGTGGVGGFDLGGSYGAGFPGENPNTVWVTNKYNPILMGGGGGAGGRGPVVGTDVGSDGGRGGGIIIILADTIFGNGNSIISNGEDVWPVADNDGGAGGGGAAGAIVISASYKASSLLTIAADGGDGGHTRNFDGFGGGGSGGLIFTNKDLASSGVSTTVIPGEEGATNYMGLPSGIPSGETGQVSDSLLIRLNGFLFNTIVSDITKSRVDSICWGDSAPKIIGSEPTGGVGPYDIKWIRRKISDVVWDTIPGEIGKDMDLTVAEDDTVFFRRVVFDANQNPKVIDVSKEVMIVVQPLITGNTIGYDTIICWNQDPDALLPIDLLGGGNFDSDVPDSTFSWRESTVNNTDYHIWDLPSEINSERDFDPGQLAVTKYYYRAVQSGRCYDTSNVITVSVLPSIGGNTIGSDQLICEDRLFTDLTGPEPTGGDGAYVYEWRRSTDDVSYLAADGTVDQLDYDPDEPIFIRDQEQMFRRFVWSGADSVCVDSSDFVSLTMWSDITGNTIYSDQTITDYGPVGLLTGDPLGGGNTGSGFTYKWEESPNGIDTWTDGTEPNTDETYQPVGLADTTWYRRIVWRAECTDTSNTVVINVHHVIGNNLVETQSHTIDTTICYGQDPHILIGSLPTGGDAISYVYLWEKSTDGITFTDADVIGHTAINFNPGVLTETTYFRRKANSGVSAESISNTVTIYVLDAISGNIITGNQTVCYDTPIEVDITSSEPTGGLGAGTYTYLWFQSIDNIDWGNVADGVNSNINYVPPLNPTVPMYYRREVKSGPEIVKCCEDISNSILVDIHDLPIGTITGISVADICADDEVTISLDMSAAGQAPYTIVLDDGTGGTLDIDALTNIFDQPFRPTSSGDFTDYTYQFQTIEDANGCFATNMTGTPNLRVHTVPTATISASTPDNICGDNVVLEATPSVGTGLWSCPDAAILSAGSASTSATTSVTVDESATYTFTWTETNWTCVDDATIDITFWEQPAPVDAGLGKTLLPLTSDFQLSADTPTAGSGLWTAEPDGGQTFSPDNHEVSIVSGLLDGVNILRWSVTNGDYCLEVSDTIMLSVTAFTVPSGFSPNMDGINDVFELNGLLENNIEAELVVTDMAGVVVYENPNYSNDWDGKNSINEDDLPDGTYYYFLRINEPEQRQYKGYVIIKRSIGKD